MEDSFSLLFLLVSEEVDKGMIVSLVSSKRKIKIPTNTFVWETMLANRFGKIFRKEVAQPYSPILNRRITTTPPQKGLLGYANQAGFSEEEEFQLNLPQESEGKELLRLLGQIYDHDPICFLGKLFIMLLK